MTFLNELREDEIGIGTYYRIRKDETIELGYENRINGKEYDNTRLIIDTNSMILHNKQAFNCKVSWFNSNDRVYFKKDNKYDEKTSYNIIVQFDIERLFTDKKYYEFFMTELLNKERVLKYLEYGMQEDPQMKCGDYIGYIDYDKNEVLNKFFDKELGEIFHYIPEKIEERKKHTEYVKNHYEIERLKQEREKLNQRINELETSRQK